MASAVVLLLVLAIVPGSRMLRDFDSALLPYAAGTVFLAFGTAHRCTVWVREPPARRLLRQGLHALSSRANFRTAPTALPRPAAVSLGFQKFLGARSTARSTACRAAHQLAFRGRLLAALTTFPLTGGWFTSTASPGAGSGYGMRLWGLQILDSSSSGAVGRAMFHGLGLAAVLVIPGAGCFLRRRLRDRTAATGRRFARPPGGAQPS
ncbi:hypothetical protein [Streptomyces endophytica]|uniref:hypothetical protein n=1 Tax=Streptomyces endophytica TaxID=2991496 RepID=UPI003C6EF520